MIVVVVCGDTGCGASLLRFACTSARDVTATPTVTRMPNATPQIPTALRNLLLAYGVAVSVDMI